MAEVEDQQMTKSMNCQFFHKKALYEWEKVRKSPTIFDVSMTFSKAFSFPWRREWQPTPVFLPGESHGQKSPVDYSP